MPISTTFLLGPSSSKTYFFNTPTHWAHSELPSDITALLTATPPVTDVVELALGTNGAYFVSYRSPLSGLLECKHYNLPNPLISWLYASQSVIVRDVRSLSIVLGPWDSYYAWDAQGASWANVPAGLEKALLKRLVSQTGPVTRWSADGYEAPSFVSLGNDGSYFMRTVSGGGCWDFRLPKADARAGLGSLGGDGWDGLRGMHKFLEDSSDFSNVAAVHLMPSHANAYVAVLTSGKMFSNLPEHTWTDYAKMADKLPQFVQQRAPLPPMPAPAAQVQQMQMPQPIQVPQPMQAPLHTPQPQGQQLYSQQYQTTPTQAQFQGPPPNYKQSQRGVSGCCGQSTTGAPHTCCAPNAMQARPWPLPPINATHM